MRSKWAWTGATHGSPKNHRSLQHLHGVCALPAHVTKTMMVTRRKPPPHLPPTAYRPLTPQSPVAPNPTFPCRRGRRRSQESPAHLGLRCVVRCVHYGLGRVQPKVRRNSQVSAAPRKVPPTLDDSALLDAVNVGLDRCNPRFAETHRSLQHRGKVPRTLDDSALFGAITMGLDWCNPPTVRRNLQVSSAPWESPAPLGRQCVVR